MFERFTESAIKVLMISQDETRKMKQQFVGTEHFLLGLIGQRHGLGAQALRKAKATPRRVRRHIIKMTGRGNGYLGSELPFTPRAKRILENSLMESRDLGVNYVSTEHLLLALLLDKDSLAMRTLMELEVDIIFLRQLTYKYIKEAQENNGRPLTNSQRMIRAREKSASTTPTLDEYADNITMSAQKGRLDPVIGRDKEISRVIVALGRRTKNNPVLLGEPGVGKTAVAEGLAQLILDENIPEFLDGAVLMSLNLGTLLAGTKYRGEFEERLKRVVKEVEVDKSVILIIDEIHTLVGAGAAEGAVDAANILKPALARGKMRVIGATTKDEYKKYVERDPALERRFQPVLVEPPDVGVTIQILFGVKGKFEAHHLLRYERGAIEQSAILADKYVQDRFLPDKAIDLLDESGSRVRLEQRRVPDGLKALQGELERVSKRKNKALRNQEYARAQTLLDRELDVRLQVSITRNAILAQKKLDGAHGLKFVPDDIVSGNDVAKTVAVWTGIPVNKITDSESERLLKMEDILKERVIGQTQAVGSVCNAIRRARVGLRNPKRPIASFIFAGPTGVGKTELTKAVADYMFNGNKSLVRLDMSEYMEKHTVAKLIGSPPGYIGYNEGGQLTEAVRATPYCVVLFDEVEKAHPDVFNLLLQILDDGRLTDSQGRLVNFTNTLIVMTTNLGASLIEEESGIESKQENFDEPKLELISNRKDDWEPKKNDEPDRKLMQKLNKLVKDELKNFFRPEFLNRIDEIIVFHHLTKHNIWSIAEIMIKELVERVAGKNIILEVQDSAKHFLVEDGYDPIYGARPLRRTIMTQLENRLAEKCLAKEIKSGTKFIFRLKDLEEWKKEMSEEMRLKDIVDILTSTPIKIYDTKQKTHIGSYDEFWFEDDMSYTDPESIFDHLVNNYRLKNGDPDTSTYTNQLMLSVVEPLERVIENKNDKKESKKKRRLFGTRLGKEEKKQKLKRKEETYSRVKDNRYSLPKDIKGLPEGGLPEE